MSKNRTWDEAALVRQRRWLGDMSPEQLHVRRERQRSYLRLRNTGWTQERYDAYIEAHGHTCAICSVETVPCVRGTDMECCDHDHATGVPRGLLCNTCNVCLGHYERTLRTRIKIDAFEKYLNTPTSA